jgi:maleylpyruvate isomerase
VEIHHVDLGAGYAPGDWPQDFATAALPGVAESFSGRDDVPGCRILPDGAAAGFWIGPAACDAAPAVVVTGPTRDLLAWLLGRGAGTGLRVAAGATLPVLPAWR